MSRPHPALEGASRTPKTCLFESEVRLGEEHLGDLAEELTDDALPASVVFVFRQPIVTPIELVAISLVDQLGPFDPPLRVAGATSMRPTPEGSKGWTPNDAMLRMTGGSDPRAPPRPRWRSPSASPERSPTGPTKPSGRRVDPQVIGVRSGGDPRCRGPLPRQQDGPVPGAR